MPIGSPVQTGSAPAKRTTPRKSTAASSAPAITQSEARYQGLLGIGQIGQAICVMRGLFADAGAISIHWPNVSRETAALASQNEQFGKLIDYAISAGPYSALLIAALPLGLQIAANHGRIDAEQAQGVAGVMAPEMLEAKVKADLEHQKLQMMREAAEAKQAAERMQAEVTAAQSENGGGGQYH